MIFNESSFEINPSPLDASGLFRPWACLFPLPSLALVLPFLSLAAQYTLSGTHFSTPSEWSFPQKIYWLFTKYRQLHPLSLTLNLPSLDSGLLFCSPLIRWVCLYPHGHSRVTWKACWNTNLVTLLCFRSPGRGPRFCISTSSQLSPIQGTYFQPCSYSLMYWNLSDIFFSFCSVTFSLK